MSGSNELLLVAEDVDRLFGVGERRASALQSVSLAVHANERVALTGRSGSGKSTLLHIMAGLDEPTGGTVSWPALGEKASLRPAKVAIMMQSPSLIPWLTVLENIALPLQLLGRPDADASGLASEGLNEFGLGDLAAKLPEEISGGQAQRVALVRATVSQPSMLLADEPTGQLDHTTAGVLMDELFAWADRTRAAIVVATHDPAIATRFAVRLKMDHGRLVTASDGVPS